MKSILITGASSGFGKGAAIALARSGWRVFASMRDLAKASELFAGLGECSGEIIPLRLDVTQTESIGAAVAELLERTCGTLDAVLCNAGYSILGAFEDYSDAQCREQMETNFFGTLAVARAVLPAMREAQRGKLIVVTSNAVNSPHPLLSMYAASKWALEGWAEGLAMEIAPFGIDVHVVQPGAHRTEFASNVRFVQPEGSAYGKWIETAMPGIGNLDAWGRDPARGISDIIALINAPSAPFRTQVGEDSKIFAALKGAAPYETRAFALRAIVGLPGSGAFTDAPPEVAEDGTMARVFAVIKHNASAEELAQAATTMFGLDRS